jgi:phosphate transport system permease protein
MNPAFLKKVRRNDRIARWVITLGGMAIIISVVFILFLIVKVSLPLFGSADVDLQSAMTLTDKDDPRNVVALGADEYRESAYVIERDGLVRFFDLHDGSSLDNFQFKSQSGEARLRSVESYNGHNQVLLWSDGSISVEQIKFYPFYDEADDNRRTIRHKVNHLADFSAPQNIVVKQSRVRISNDRQVRTDLLEDGRLRLVIIEEHESFLGEIETLKEIHFLKPSIQGEISALTLTSSGDYLYVGTDQGELLRWDLGDMEDPVLIEQIQAFDDQRAITALRMVFGDVSLAVGDETGMLTTWFPVRDENSVWKLTRIHDLHQHKAPVETIVTTLTDKSVISIAADGILYSHMTSERQLAQLDFPEHIERFSLTSRSDGILAVTDKGTLLFWTVEIPHPEISLKTLFGKVWYEGYPQPEYVWQSSSGSDDYEPKLSLTPLMFGTLKGTFYAMFFALPLAIFGAIYTSQFARPKFKGIVKPAVEVMAAVPTVIIGFLAALWLAPLIERSLGSLFLSLIMIPAALMIAIAVWQVARRAEPLKRIEKGYEFLAVSPIIVLAVAIAAGLGLGMENLLFKGSLQQWLFTEVGTRYDPRNCIIIAFAMGFAVIPIIFTIAEDALSNVPPALRAASLALGASRWQTVWRVILPSASPGIFAGTMIGFGRAVGETMIVLMATGNTAIMDLSIFNGMRPLSANIAVEIPEAPVDGSLYRTLFLSAVILFVMTFIVNTLAEIVRQRLRAKYGRF